jgi:hypothetical protein
VTVAVAATGRSDGTSSTITASAAPASATPWRGERTVIVSPARAPSAVRSAPSVGSAMIAT